MIASVYPNDLSEGSRHLNFSINGLLIVCCNNPFLVPYYATSMGVIYTGEVSMAAVKLGTPYANAMRELTVTLKWQTGKLQRSRSLTTFVSQNGLHNYIY